MRRLAVTPPLFAHGGQKNVLPAINIRTGGITCRKIASRCTGWILNRLPAAIRTINTTHLLAVKAEFKLILPPCANPKPEEVADG